MRTIELNTDSREILGKKVKLLRQQKITPLHLFGQGQQSLALQCHTREIELVLSQAGETRLISLKVDKEEKPRPVLVREVTRQPLTGELLHVDFFQVKMDEKIQVDVPIVLTGEAPALKTKGSSLAQELNTLSVECLPDNIPNKIEVNIDSLSDVGNGIRVADITVDSDIDILDNPEQLVVIISKTHVEEEKTQVEEPSTEPSEESPQAGEKEEQE